MVRLIGFLMTQKQIHVMRSRLLRVRYVLFSLVKNARLLLYQTQLIHPLNQILHAAQVPRLVPRQVAPVARQVVHHQVAQVAPVAHLAHLAHLARQVALPVAKFL